MSVKEIDNDEGKYTSPERDCPVVGYPLSINGEDDVILFQNVVSPREFFYRIY